MPGAAAGDPAALMQMERGWRLYLHYFERKWRRSLERKRALFPRLHDYDDRTLRLGMRELTEWLVLRHTDFGSLEHYFDGYSIAGERLAALQVPARILMAEDDPVIPVDHFRALRLPAEAKLSAAVIVNPNTPVVVGVPAISPLLVSSASPGGSEPTTP